MEETLLIVVGIAVVVAGVLLMTWLGAEAIMEGSWRMGLGAFVLLVLLLSAMVVGIKSESDSGPCLRYEHSMYYNAGTKSMMPIRLCAERAEWVQE